MFRPVPSSCLAQRTEPEAFLLTTKLTKDTKGSDINIFKLLNFVLFVTFVMNCSCLFRLRRALGADRSTGQERHQREDEGDGKSGKIASGQIVRKTSQVGAERAA